MANVIEINDVDDSRVERYANLRSDVVAAATAEYFIVEGQWCLQRLVASPHKIDSVLVERGRETVASRMIDSETPIYSLPRDAVRELVGFDFHRGLLACGVRPKLREITELELGGERPSVALAILGVSERDNLGSMMRTAAALGVADLLIGPKTIDPFSRRAVRVSMAAVLHQTLYRLDHPADQLQQLAEQKNMRTVVTTLEADATPLDEFAGDGRPCIIVVGSEASGVAAEIQQIATDRVTIPMHLGTDSLNVSVAAAIFLYELLQHSQSR